MKTENTDENDYLIQLFLGESYTSLHYAFRIRTSTISEFVPEVCQAIYHSLQSKYLQVWLNNGFEHKLKKKTLQLQ